jgi:hypothetical protein
MNFSRDKSQNQRCIYSSLCINSKFPTIKRIEQKNNQGTAIMQLLSISILRLAATTLFFIPNPNIVESFTTLLSGGPLTYPAVAATFISPTNQQNDHKSLSLAISDAQQKKSIPTLNLNGEVIPDRFSSADEQFPDGSFYKLYHFEGRENQTINIEIDSHKVKPIMTLFQVTQSEEGEMDLVPVAISDLDSDTPAQLMANLEADGSYMLLVSSDSNEETVSYTIKASAAP